MADLASAVELARKQADPEAEEFVAQGVRTDLKELRVNTTKLNDRNQQPGILRRLARSRPDLLGKVETGELSPNAAAIEAGFRRPMKSIPVDTAENAVRALTKALILLNSSKTDGGHFRCDPCAPRDEVQHLHPTDCRPCS